MKSSIANSIILSAFLSKYILVDSFATTSVASTSSECDSSSVTIPCPTVTTEPSPTTQIPNDRATRMMKLTPSTPSSKTPTSYQTTSTNLLSQYSQLPPLGVSLHPRMGRASSPTVAIERFHLIRTTLSPTNRGGSTIPNGDDGGESFQNKLLLQTAAVHHAITETATNDTNTTLTTPPTSTTNNTFSWKMALSTITLLSIGGTIASAVFVITTPPGQLFSTTPTVAAIQSLIVGFLSTTTSLFSTTNLPPLPPPTAINVYLHQATTYIQTKILPVALPALQKMALMELWRNIWSTTFRSLRQVYSYLFGGVYSDSVWRMYVPSFIRMGLKKVGIRAVQMKVEGFVWDLWNWSSIGGWWYDGEVDGMEYGDVDGSTVAI